MTETVQEEILVELAKRRANEPAYLLLTDEEAIEHIQKERDQKKEEAEIKANLAFPVIVDYSQTLDQMIAAGKFGYMNENITEENYPLPKIPAGLPTKVELNLELIHFNRYIKSDQAIAELKKLGLCPATLPELLAFATRYPDKQREFPIVALGSVGRDGYGNRRIPYLWFDISCRGLDLGWSEDGWFSSCRFLAVREPTCQAGRV